MNMIDEELMRLRNRLKDLQERVIPDFENRTQALYARIISMQKGSEEREREEAEYTKLARELSIRSDEVINTRQQIENLELQKTMR